MAKAPAFQFYPADFLADENVAVMTTEEVGAYFLLICFCWREGSLPNDPKRLAKLTRLSAKKFSSVWPAVAPCFEDRDGVLIHPRLEKERERQGENREKRRSAAEKRWNGNGGNHAHAMHMHGRGDAGADALQCLSSSTAPSSSTAVNKYPPQGGEGGATNGHAADVAEAHTAAGMNPDDAFDTSTGPRPAVDPATPELAEARQSALSAFSRWAEMAPPVGRRQPLNEIRNEHYSVFALVLELSQQSPVIEGDRQIPRHLLIPRAVDALVAKQKPFKAPKWAAGCVRSEIEDWANSGIESSPARAPGPAPPPRLTARQRDREEAERAIDAMEFS